MTTLTTTLLAMVLSWDAAGYYGRGIDISRVEYFGNETACENMQLTLNSMPVLHPGRDVRTDNKNFCWTRLVSYHPDVPTWDLAIQAAVVNANSRPMDRAFIRNYADQSECQEHANLIKATRFENHAGVKLDAECSPNQNHAPE